MGVWLAAPKLAANETIQWQSSASRSITRWLTAGGRLFVTNERVLFQPNRFDKLTGKKSWECPLASVTGLEVIDRDSAVAPGGLRTRLGLQTSDGTEKFVVNNLDQKIVELRELLPQLSG